MSNSPEKENPFEPIDIIGTCMEQLADVVGKRYVQFKDRWKHDVPKQLSEIISTCIAASTHTEEKQQLRFQIICADPEAVKKTGALAPLKMGWDIGISQTEVLAPHRLCKLASAFGPANCGILVWDGKDGPAIWGLARLTDFGRAAPPHNIRRVACTRALRIRASGPGALVFDNLAHVFAEFEDGKLTFPQSLPIFTNRGTLFRDCIEQFAWASIPTDWMASKFVHPDGSPNWHYVSDWTDIYIAFLLSVLRAIQQHGHGGTLVISNDSSFPGIQYPNYRLSSGFDVQNDGMPSAQVRMCEYLKSIINCETDALANKFPDLDAKGAIFFGVPDVHKLHFDYSELVRTARFVGGLTAADGAVILNAALRVCAVGAKLKTGDLPTCRHITWDAMMRGGISPSQPELSTLPVYQKPRGNRFNSAVQCALKDPQSLVFIASEDGPVAALMQLNGEVLIAEPVDLESPMSF